MVSISQLDMNLDYPYCIVWSPMSPHKWLNPFLGHFGIGLGCGIVCTFPESEFISREKIDKNPARYLQLDPKNANEGNIYEWDSKVFLAVSLLTIPSTYPVMNCYEKLAEALNIMEYMHSTNWNVYNAFLWVWFYGKYADIYGFFRTWYPFTITVSCAFACWYTLDKFVESGSKLFLQKF